MPHCPVGADTLPPGLLSLFVALKLSGLRAVPMLSVVRLMISPGCFSSPLDIVQLCRVGVPVPDCLKAIISGSLCACCTDLDLWVAWAGLTKKGLLVEWRPICSSWLTGVCSTEIELMSKCVGLCCRGADDARSAGP